MGVKRLRIRRTRCQLDMYSLYLTLARRGREQLGEESPFWHHPRTIRHNGRLVRCHSIKFGMYALYGNILFCDSVGVWQNCTVLMDQ